MEKRFMKMMKELKNLNESSQKSKTEIEGLKLKLKTLHGKIIKNDELKEQNYNKN